LQGFDDDLSMEFSHGFRNNNTRGKYHGCITMMRGLEVHVDIETIARVIGIPTG
jgi:hypothetical protein